MNKKLTKIFMEIEEEFMSATKKFGTFHNAHEGYAVLLEEVDELWENVKLNQSNSRRNKLIHSEAIHVATMALRLIYDCCEIDTFDVVELDKRGKFLELLEEFGDDCPRYDDCVNSGVENMEPTHNEGFD